MLRDKIDVENKEKVAAVATSEDEVEKHKVVELDEDFQWKKTQELVFPPTHVYCCTKCAAICAHTKPVCGEILQRDVTFPPANDLD